MRYYTSVDGYTIDTGSSPFTPQTCLLYTS